MWKKINKNKLGLFGLVFITGLTAVSLLGYLIIPDSSTNANDIHLEIALQKNPDAKILSFVHAETSTGVRSDAKEIAEISKKYGCLVIADTVTSFTGIPIFKRRFGK